MIFSWIKENVRFFLLLSNIRLIQLTINVKTLSISLLFLCVLKFNIFRKRILSMCVCECLYASVPCMCVYVPVRECVCACVHVKFRIMLTM